MKKKLSFIILFTFIGGLSVVYSQTTVVLHPKTASVWNITPTSAGGNSQDFIATNWTHSGANSIVRSFMNFDLSSIPSGSTITSATLSLYWHQSISNTGHSTLSGSNASWLRRTTTPYYDSTVTWNTQPTYTTINEVYLQETTNDTISFPNVDVTNLINDIRNNPASGNGLIFMLDNEQYYRAMLFASSEAPEINKRPILKITYTSSNPQNDTCISIKINNDEGGYDASVWNITPTTSGGSSQDFIATNWTHSGANSIVRSLINFDLNSIPTGATITSAKLNLYWHQSISNTGHSTLSGSNASWLRRITTPWNYNTVTWNTQPLYTTQNEVYLPETTNDTMNYPNIDVTNLIIDIRNNPTSGYGMVFILDTEQYYRSMLFASSNAPETNKRPVLEVCYQKNSSIHENNLIANNTMNIYPNPSSYMISVDYSFKINSDVTIDFYSLDGKLLDHIDLGYETKGNHNLQYIMNPNVFQAGIYLLKISSDNGIITRRFMKID